MSYLPVLFGYHASNVGNSHVPISLCRHWNDSGKKALLTVPSKDDAISYPWIRSAMNPLVKAIIHKFGDNSHSRPMAEKLFRKNAPERAPVYLWAGLSAEVFEHFSREGSIIIMERINCHRATSCRILSEVSASLGMNLPLTFRDEDIAEENRKLALADSIFCPSPMVERSMLENGVPANKLLPTSYGWEPERFATVSEPRKVNSRPVFLFAGTLCIRKGVPLLLEAWKRADIDGELILCGRLHDEIRKDFPR